MRAPNKKKKPKFSTKTRYKYSRKFMYKETRKRIPFVGGFYNGWVPTVRKSKNFVINDIVENRTYLVPKYMGPYALTAKYENREKYFGKEPRCRIPKYLKRKLKYN